ncbi:hypothetical protein LC607_13395 [Nostoc sp. CHAB 5824]|nr:hypothetical protein [Nostoc sp. CHAB 5824]
MLFGYSAIFSTQQCLRRAMTLLRTLVPLYETLRERYRFANTTLSVSLILRVNQGYAKDFLQK